LLGPDLARWLLPAHAGRLGPLGQTEQVLYAVLSGRYDRLIWGAVAIAAALVISKILRRVVASLESDDGA
jgi:hypothetical protein